VPSLMTGMLSSMMLLLEEKEDHLWWLKKDGRI
jgi:hypothetical protein